MKSDVVFLLGGERQVATSFALAYSGRRFNFVSDRPVIDGWDMSNVTMVPSVPESFFLPSHAGGFFCVPLDSQWISPTLTPGPGAPSNNLNNAFRLSVIFETLTTNYPSLVLPVSSTPPKGEWIAKGDAFHLPGPVSRGTQNFGLPIADPHEAGIVFQPFEGESQNLLVVGRRSKTGNLGLGVFHIHGEGFLREDFLMAGETIQNDSIGAYSKDILETLDHTGFFSMNWILRDNRPLLTSFRPLPRSVIGCLLKAGVDCLDLPDENLVVARAGVRFSMEFHYSSYEILK